MVICTLFPARELFDMNFDWNFGEEILVVISFRHWSQISTNLFHKTITGLDIEFLDI